MILYILGSKRCAKRPRGSPGLTLIEVLVAMVILGTLLATAVTARGRYMTQLLKASAKQQAVKAADSLLNNWSVNWDTHCDNSTGVVSDDSTLTWRREVTEPSEIRDLGARVLRLEVSQIMSPVSQVTPATASSPLVTVEVLIPLATVRLPESDKQPQTRESNGLQ